VHIGSLFGKFEKKKPVGRPSCRWESNSKMSLQEVEWGVHWIDLAQVRDKW
jgi:hypothetical protein